LPDETFVEGSIAHIFMVTIECEEILCESLRPLGLKIYHKDRKENTQKGH
jgi:hypothetical protein